MQVSDEKATRKPAKSTTTSGEKSQGFTDAERAAMRARAKEQKAEARADKDRADGESAVIASIAAMPESDRAMGERLHAIIKASAPALASKTWYGMPAYAKDGKIVCFFRSGDKFNERYLTLGFNDVANLDEGAIWPIAFALTELTVTDEARIAALVKKAVGRGRAVWLRLKAMTDYHKSTFVRCDAVCPLVFPHFRPLFAWRRGGERGYRGYAFAVSLCRATPSGV